MGWLVLDRVSRNISFSCSHLINIDSDKIFQAMEQPEVKPLTRFDANFYPKVSMLVPIPCRFMRLRFERTHSSTYLGDDHALVAQVIGRLLWE